MVATFPFDLARRQVLLIKKERPAWQVGKLNGIGGKMEAGESAAQAAARELREEAAIDAPKRQFQKFCIVTGPDWRVHFFRLFVSDLTYSQKTDEELIVMNVDSLHFYNIIWNLRWLIPMALDTDLVVPTMVYDGTKYEDTKKMRVWGA